MDKGVRIVLVPWRRRGIGWALLDRSIELTRTLGLDRVRLLTCIEDGSARALHESVGFSSGQTMIDQRLLDRENAES